MSPQEPQERKSLPNGPVGRWLRRLRQMPGFTVAAAAFVLVVTMGAGGVAMANWNQSATATIDITAGAAPAPSPTPTPTPTPTPPPADGRNIVANPVIATRPSKLNAENVSCGALGSSGQFRFDWDRDPANGISYVVSLSSSDSGYGTPQTQTVTKNTVTFRFDRTPAAYGNYIIRIQPMNGTVAGDPVYRTFKHSEQLTANCFFASGDGQSPLGAFAFSTAPVAPAPNDNILILNWAAAPKATSYVVSIKSKTSSYGAEFTTSTLGATLVFPPRVRNEWGNVTNSGDYFGQYLLRVIPMNGGQAGDPIYKVVQYQANDFTIWDTTAP
ncbi:hypothetical protein [Arthrobacter sp. GMC3]|uniref:hypothetical protein n=1 Tax=Arthrobacter sp. GMC3 TaxID=2058894 RepID=UPI000CE31D4A|nr:hypothetical protein [Arthrobacter sp. GMC3]